MTSFPRDLALFRREVDRLFDSATRATAEPADVWSPRADVVETEGAYELSLDLPGVGRDALDITLEDGTLSISGERAVDSRHQDGRFHRVERRYGRFFRSFTLGSDLDPDAVEATYDDGVLHVTVGKSERVQPRRIAIGSVRSTGDSEDVEIEDVEVEEA